jgi:hypothetical protein
MQKIKSERAYQVLSDDEADYDYHRKKEERK